MRNFIDPSRLVLLNFTVQLYYHPFGKGSEIKPQQVASGILIKTNTDYFLLTCRHVFKNINPNDLIILTTSGKDVRLPNKAEFISADGNDNIDLAIIEWDSEQNSKLKERYSFLHFKNILFEHEYSNEKLYMLLGFINNQTILENKVFKSYPFGYLTSIKTIAKIEDLGFNYTQNITLEYNRRKQSFIDSSSINFGPKDLKGLSGGGIWYCEQKTDAPNLMDCSLAGIMIEERTERGFIIGTKISLTKDTLQKRLL